MKSHTTKLIIFTMLVSNLALASVSGRQPRSRSEEDLAAAIKESLSMDEARRNKAAEEERQLEAAMAASQLTAARAPAGAASFADMRAAAHASIRTAAAHQERRAHEQALASRPEAVRGARAEAVIDSAHWSNPAYLRAHIGDIIANKEAYIAIIAHNLTIEEKFAPEGAFHKGGGALEMGYRRAKIERVIAKLEGRA